MRRFMRRCCARLSYSWSGSAWLCWQVSCARRVVRPLEALRQGVERIREGDLSARFDVKTGDEIEILADEFNDMAAHLRDAYAGLERKVAERTQALTIANEKLAEASEHKSQFLANVNHELRTPVSAIIGYAESAATPKPKVSFRHCKRKICKICSVTPSASSTSSTAF